MLSKTVQVRLNRFVRVPASLRVSGPLNEPISTTGIDLAQLFHHYYLDSYGRLPPSPDPTRFEYLEFLANTQDFRFQGKGVGSHRQARRNRSMELAQAFCRWFLSRHIGMVYFAHMEQVLENGPHCAFGPLKVEQVEDGDGPDYLCARTVDRICLGEAKGRYDTIGFNTKEFESWRKQCARISVSDSNGPVAIKSYIVGTRFATESKPNVLSCVYAEDPPGVGRTFEEWENRDWIFRLIVGNHYSRIVIRLGQDLLGAALRGNFTVPHEIQFVSGVWRCLLPGLDAREFYGGYFLAPGARPPIAAKDGQFFPGNALDLGAPEATFVGLDRAVGRLLAQSARTGSEALRDVEPIVMPAGSGASNVSCLEDGSIIGPLGFFRFVRAEEW